MIKLLFEASNPDVIIPQVIKIDGVAHAESFEDVAERTWVADIDEDKIDMISVELSKIEGVTSVRPAFYRRVTCRSCGLK